MIYVQRSPIAQHLAPAERARLAKRRAIAKGYEMQDARIDPAWNNFRRTKSGKATYRALKIIFRSKCAYCERVNAGTVDHYYPRKRYPKRMFHWSNPLLCCAECNPAKGEYFPFLKGCPVLLDPTKDDPLEYYTWDLSSGAMVDSVDPVRGPRAKSTRIRLKLDDGALEDERKVQLNRIVYLLAQAVNEHPTIRSETRQRLAEELQSNRHFLGIVRFLLREPNKFRSIVDDARAKLPDIDVWTAGWL